MPVINDKRHMACRRKFTVIDKFVEDTRRGNVKVKWVSDKRLEPKYIYRYTPTRKKYFNLTRMCSKSEWNISLLIKTQNDFFWMIKGWKWINFVKLWNSDKNSFKTFKLLRNNKLQNFHPLANFKLAVHCLIMFSI